MEEGRKKLAGYSGIGTGRSVVREEGSVIIVSREEKTEVDEEKKEDDSEEV
jgi:hypothetical protein